MDIAPDPPSQKRKRPVNSTTPAIDVAAYLNDDSVPVMNKVQLLKFGRDLDLDQSISLLEKYRLLQAWVVLNESMSGDTSNS